MFCMFEQTPGVGDGQGSLVCCDSWGHKESYMTEWLNWILLLLIFSLFSLYDTVLSWFSLCLTNHSFIVFFFFLLNPPFPLDLWILEYLIACSFVFFIFYMHLFLWYFLTISISLIKTSLANSRHMFPPTYLLCSLRGLQFCVSETELTVLPNLLYV